MRAVNGLRERFASQAVILSEFTAASMPEKHHQRRISAVRHRSRQDSSLVTPLANNIFTTRYSAPTPCHPERSASQ